jgi:hypothetical protein
MAKFQIHKSQFVNQFFDATQNSSGVGGVGGLLSIPGVQINPSVYVTGGTKGASGYIMRSKGRGKFLMGDSTNRYPNSMVNGSAYLVTSPGNTNWESWQNHGPVSGAGDIFTAMNTVTGDSSSGLVNIVGVCTFTNVGAQYLTAGQASLAINLNQFTANVGNLGASGATTFMSVIFANANVVGVSRPTVGSVLSNISLGIVGNATITSIAAYGTNGSNANVAISSQTVANLASVTANTIVYTSRLSNKTAIDFNGNKYFWGNGAPSATTVQIPTA